MANTSVNSSASPAAATTGAQSDNNDNNPFISKSLHPQSSAGSAVPNVNPSSSKLGYHHHHSHQQHHHTQHQPQYNHQSQRQHAGAHHYPPPPQQQQQYTGYHAAVNYNSVNSTQQPDYTNTEYNTVTPSGSGAWAPGTTDYRLSNNGYYQQQAGAHYSGNQHQHPSQRHLAYGSAAGGAGQSYAAGGPHHHHYTRQHPNNTSTGPVTSPQPSTAPPNGIYFPLPNHGPTIVHGPPPPPPPPHHQQQHYYPVASSSTKQPSPHLLPAFDLTSRPPHTVPRDHSGSNTLATSSRTSDSTISQPPAVQQGPNHTHPSSSASTSNANGHPSTSSDPNSYATDNAQASTSAGAALSGPVPHQHSAGSLPPARQPRSSRRARPSPSAEAPAISVGPNVKPPPEYKSRFPVAAVGRFIGTGATPSPSAITTSRSSTPVAKQSAANGKVEQIVEEKAGPALTESATGLQTPLQPRPVASLLFSATGSAASTPSRDLSSVSTTATIASSSHPSSPILTPSSPATTTTTLDEVDAAPSTTDAADQVNAAEPEATSISPAAVGAPGATIAAAVSDPSLQSAPATPKSPPSTTATSTPGGSARKSWADLLRSPSSAVPAPLLPNGQPAQSMAQHVPRASGSSVSTSSPLRAGLGGVAAPATLAGALAGVERQFALIDGAEIAPRGLINNGNMCFANSILQVLVYCAPFWNLMQVLRRETKGDLSGQSKTPSMDAVINFLEEFRSTSTVSIVPPRHRTKTSSASQSLSSSAVLHTSSSASGFPSLSPGATADSAFLPPLDADPFVPDRIYDALKPNPRFDAMVTRGQQEDAEEFLGFLLDALHDEILGAIDRTDGTGPLAGNSDGGKEDDEQGWEEVGTKGRIATTRTTESRESPVTKIFSGQLRSVLRCPGQKDSITLEPYQRLQLDIQPEHVRTIEDALLNLTQPEHLPDFVSRSGLRTDAATKQVYLETFPPVLILHLKRFLYDNVGGVQKSGKPVGYGTELEVPAQVVGPAKRTGTPVRYQLFGVVYHHGLYASGGHYTVAVRQQVNSNLWLHIDDTSIRPISPAEVAVGRDGMFHEGDKNAYLLLYNRMS